MSSEVKAPPINTCWVCDQDDLSKVKESDIKDGLGSDQFAITNADYGMTGELSQCANCGFIQCTSDSDVISYYEDLVDEQYEDTRKERKLQEQGVLNIIKKIKPSGHILDIGAGSGIMIESALEMGYTGVGVEPSKWLCEQAAQQGLPVKQGIFPMEGLDDKFDVIALVDVIEHVNNPKQLFRDIKDALQPDGIFAVITPDVSSVAAKLLKYKWWHFRVAHIGYFNDKTIELMADEVGLECVKRIRPSWYFRVGYLVDRVHTYLPKFLRIPAPGFIRRMVIPLNLRDSLFYVFKLKSN